MTTPESVPVKTDEAIAALPLQERIAYAQSIRTMILQKLPITREHIRAALLAANLTLVQQAAKNPRSRGVPKDAPKAEPTLADLLP